MTGLKDTAYQIALVIALFIVGALGVKLYFAESEVSEQKVAIANAAASFARYVADGAKLTSQANQRNRDLEWRIVKGAKDAQQEKAHALEALAAEHAAAIAGLQNRPSRPAPGRANNLPAAGATATAEQGCGRERLYREDAEVVVRLAHAAAELRLELLATRSQYERAEALLNAQALTQ